VCAIYSCASSKIKKVFRDLNGTCAPLTTIRNVCRLKWNSRPIGFRKTRKKSKKFIQLGYDNKFNEK